jgi:lambda family phage minor tail protein L
MSSSSNINQINDRQNARLEVGRSLVEMEQSAILELFEFYFDKNLEPFRFHAGTNGIEKSIIFNNKKYVTAAVEVEGFEMNIMGRLPRPKITVLNTDFIVSSIMKDYSDFTDSRFVRIKIFLKNLDNANFENNINPFGNPNPLAVISADKFLVSQKLVENNKLVQFELITPFDLESLQIATRAIYGRYCYWQYRGSGCGYKGDLICNDDDTEFLFPPTLNFHIRDSLGNFVVNNSYADTVNRLLWNVNSISYSLGDVVALSNEDYAGVKDPPYSFYVCVSAHISSIHNKPNTYSKFWQKDGCSKTIAACKKRFDSFSTKNGLINNDFFVMNGILPFGGFPGTDTFRYE